MGDGGQQNEPRKPLRPVERDPRRQHPAERIAHENERLWRDPIKQGHDSLCLTNRFGILRIGGPLAPTLAWPIDRNDPIMWQKW